MGTIYEELQRILATQKARGVERAWISPENMQAFCGPSLMRMPSPASAASNTIVSNSAPPTTLLRPAPQPQVRTVPQPPPSTAPQPPQMTVQPPMFHTFRGMTQAPAQQQDIQLTPAPDVSAMDWEPLKEAALACHACRLYAGRHNMVFEDGCRTARVMFIGEGPGEDEDRQGVPFVGRAGQLLTRMILAMGLDRNSQDPSKAAYIANIVKCRPPGNRNPAPEEGNVCIHYLKRQIQLVQPKVIVLLGNVPLSFLMGKTGITRLRGQWLQYCDIPVMPTFHPAYILRFERDKLKFIEEKRKVWADLQQVMAKLGLPLPK